MERNVVSIDSPPVLLCCNTDANDFSLYSSAQMTSEFKSDQGAIAASKPMRLPSVSTPSEIVVYAADAVGPKEMWEKILSFRRFRVSSISELFKCSGYPQPVSYCIDLDVSLDRRILDDGQDRPQTGHAYVFVILSAK
jgi:hypothetical protein